MVDEWIECKILDACRSVDYGLTASAVNENVGPKFLRITDIVPGYIDWRSVPYVSSDEQTSAKYRLDDGDIVLARTGASTGASIYIKNPPPAVFASYLVRLKAKDEFDSRFLAYYLKSGAFSAFISAVLGDKSAQPNASAATMTQAPLRAPKNKHEQRAISHVLGALDDKAELNRHMIDTLHAMTRAVFKSWFVDFMPVLAKMDGRWQRGQSLPGLPAHLFDFFPTTMMTHTTLGEIPEGWRAGSLKEIASIVMGQSPDGESYNNDGIGEPLINGPVEFGDYFPVKTKWTTSPTRLSEAGDLILCVRGSTTGKRVIADSAYCLGRGVCAIRPKVGFNPFLYQIIDTGLDRLLSKTTGSVFPNLSGPDIKNFEILLPPQRLIEAFCTIAAPWKEEGDRTIRELETLTAFRNNLLPKLISGELRVKEAERLLAGSTL